MVGKVYLIGDKIPISQVVVSQGLNKLSIGILSVLADKLKVNLVGEQLVGMGVFYNFEESCNAEVNLPPLQS
jgi:hypothetical protein